MIPIFYHVNKNNERIGKMKRILLVSIFALLAVSSLNYGQDSSMTGTSRSTKPSASMMAQEIVNMEDAVITTVKNKEIDQFRNYLSDDFVGVYDMGITSKTDEIQGIQKMELKNASRTDEKVIFPTDDVAIITYKSKEDGSSEGKDFSGNYNVSTTWVKRDGKWMVVQHTEVKEQK
ncbi:MAG: nuclear transport factor 2 family protein [Methanococcaceae archaeon]